jgi:hypothetical protein
MLSPQREFCVGDSPLIPPALCVSEEMACARRMIKIWLPRQSRRFVRLEILAGLELKTVIIPVLLAEAEMPSAKSLPEPLQPFAPRNAIE